MNINEILVLAAITVFVAWFALRLAVVKARLHGSTHGFSATDRSSFETLPYTSYLMDPPLR
jgi:hypothetical protein